MLSSLNEDDDTFCRANLSPPASSEYVACRQGSRTFGDAGTPPSAPTKARDLGEIHAQHSGSALNQGSS